MRVLHVIPVVSARYGGPSTAIWPMVQALRSVDGIEVEVATTDGDGLSSRITTADLPKEAGAVHLFKKDDSRFVIRSRAMTDWLNSHARDYDIVQTHSNWTLPVAAACRAARRSDVPYVMRPCGMLSDYSWRKSFLKKHVYWWLQERFNVRNASGFHVTSSGERDEVSRLGVDAKIEVIPLGIGSDAWSAPVEPNWLRELCPQSGSRPIVLYLSRLHPKKGITDFLLPAFRRLKTDAFLVIAGGDDDHAPGFTQQVQAEVIRLGLQDKVALIGAVERGRRWAAFDGADLFALPSHSENFGIVVAEAMARGKPVVISNGVQFCEHVTASNAGEVVSLDVEILAASLDSWLGDASKRERAGQLGKQYIQKNFTWARTAERLVELYSQIRRAR